MIFVLPKHMSKEVKSNTGQRSQEIASLLKTPNPIILKNSLGRVRVTPEQYCFCWFNQDRSIFCFVFDIDQDQSIFLASKVTFF